MSSDFLPEFSLEQEFAHKLAAQELAKYCEEFARWRRTKKDWAVMDKSAPKRGMLVPPATRKPAPPAPRSSA